MRIKVLAVLFAFFNFFNLSAVEAHPHVFITPKAEIVGNDHFVSQINVEWDFDDMSSSLFLESSGSDTGEIWSLVFPDMQLTADGQQVARSNYYTDVEIDGTPVDDLKPENFNASFVNGKLYCTFTLYINKNVDSTLKLWFDDPTIYNAFDIEPENFSVSGTAGSLQKQTENDIDKIYLSF